MSLDVKNVGKPCGKQTYGAEEYNLIRAEGELELVDRLSGLP